MEPVLVALTPDLFAAALNELLSIYTSAMNYDESVARARATLWLEHCRRPGFRCVVAVRPRQCEPPVRAAPAGDDPVTRAPTEDPAAGPIIGFGYGYRGAPGQWWYGEVARGLGSTAHPDLADYFELTELHVRPAWQGAGIGESLLRDLLKPVPCRSVLLSTPEGDSRAWHLYRRLGFRDVLRAFHFLGDSRPFAVLGRALPLAAGEAQGPTAGEAQGPTAGPSPAADPDPARQQ